jgi:phage FluMu gp28-like protein
MAVTLSDQEANYLKSLVPSLAEQLVYLDGTPIKLEKPWQVNLLGATNTSEVWAKSRQIGYSWGTALRVLLRAHLFPPASYNAVLVSINREEAREKIRYVESMLDGLKNKKKTKIANKMEIEFENGNRIQSFPARAVRGIPNVDLYLDEFAHVKEAREIYAGSTASTVRQSYGVTVGSTPYGRGAFYDIFHGAGNDGEYKNFVSHEVPWWHSYVLCKDVHKASMFAPGMRTEERVREYGRPNLVHEYETQSLETFQVEFEVKFADHGNSALTEELILGCSNGDLACQVVDIDCEESSLQPMELVRMALDAMQFDSKVHDCFIGYDVGRQVHASELILLDYVGGKLKTRMYLTLRKAPYPLQKQIVTYLMNELPVRRCTIDSQGIGNPVSEELHNVFSTRIRPMAFSETTKSTMVNQLVKVFEEKSLVLYPTRRMLTQLLEVQKFFSTTGRILYRSAVSKEGSGDSQHKSHADLFWSLAMAVVGAEEYISSGNYNITTRTPILWGQSGVSGWSGKRKGLTRGW